MADAINKLSVEGKLEEFPFPRLFQYLHERKATGRLMLRKADITKVVLMVEGKPVNVDSTLRDETLGRYLIKKGKISEEDFEKSIQLMMTHNLQQGAALVRLGCLSAKELYHEVKAQSREKLLSCFSWTQADFEFYPEVSFIEDTYRFEMSVASVMHEGINRFFPPGAIEAQLARASPGPISPVSDFMERIGDYELSDEESEFVLIIDGERDLMALKEEAGSYSFGPRLLYLLLVAGLIGPQGKPDQAIRSMGDKDLIMPPIEEFVLSAKDTAPEAVEEEILPSHEPPEIEEEEEEVVWEGEPEGAEADAHKMSEVESELQETPGQGMEVEEIEMEVEDEEEEVSVRVDEVQAKDEGDGKELLTPSQPPPLEPESSRDESEILEFYMGIKSADFFALLGISRDATDAEVEKAYRRLLAEYDSSQFESLSSEAQAKLEEVHTRIIRAYEALRTEENRGQYLARLEAKTEAGNESLQAEHFLQKGLKYVRKRDWANAQKMFEQAVMARPGEPEYRGYLGWTIYSNTELDHNKRTEKAKALIKEAIELNPHVDSPHVFMAKILKEEGKGEQALEEFEAALRCNPKCREAQRELKGHEQGEW